MSDEGFKRDVYVSSGDSGSVKPFDWAQICPYSADKLGATWAENLPLDTSVSVKMNGGAQATIEMTGRRDGHTVFTAEDCYIYKSDPARSFMRIDEVRVEEALRGEGIGKQFLKNTVQICDDMQIKEIQLRAGREDGAFFWARHGFVLEGEWVLGKLGEIKENLARLKDQLSEKSVQKVEALFEEGNVNIIWGIVDLPDVIDGKPAGAALLRGVEYRAKLDLTDHEQRARLDVALARGKPPQAPQADIEATPVQPQMQRRPDVS